MIDVAVGVVYRGDAEILIARRPQDVEQGGLWEFPGGKVESGESPRDALTREIAEEIASADREIALAKKLLETTSAGSAEAIEAVHRREAAAARR